MSACRRACRLSLGVRAETHVSSKDFLSIELENQTQHSVRGRMLRSKVDGKMSERAVLSAATLAKNLMCTLVVELLDSESRSGGRSRCSLGRGSSVLSLGSERTTSGGGEKPAGRRCSARAVEVGGRSHSAEERRCHGHARWSKFRVAVKIGWRILV